MIKLLITEVKLFEEVLTYRRKKFTWINKVSKRERKTKKRKEVERRRRGYLTGRNKGRISVKDEGRGIKDYPK